MKTEVLQEIFLTLIHHVFFFTLIHSHQTWKFSIKFHTSCTSIRAVLDINNSSFTTKVFPVPVSRQSFPNHTQYSCYTVITAVVSASALLLSSCKWMPVEIFFKSSEELMKRWSGGICQGGMKQGCVWCMDCSTYTLLSVMDMESSVVASLDTSLSLALLAGATTWPEFTKHGLAGSPRFWALKTQPVVRIHAGYSIWYQEQNLAFSFTRKRPIPTHLFKMALGWPEG